MLSAVVVLILRRVKGMGFAVSETFEVQNGILFRRG